LMSASREPDERKTEDWQDVGNVKRRPREWLKACLAAAAIGATSGLASAGVLAVCASVSPVGFDALRAVVCIVGVCVAVVVTVTFLRLFAVGDIEAKEICRSIGKLFGAFAKERPGLDCIV